MKPIVSYSTNMNAQYTGPLAGLRRAASRRKESLLTGICGKSVGNPNPAGGSVMPSASHALQRGQDSQ